MTQLREELNAVLKKHEFLAVEFESYKKNSEEQFAKLNTALAKERAVFKTYQDTTLRDSKDKESDEKKVNIVKAEQSTATASATSTPAKSNGVVPKVRESWKLKDAEILTSNAIKMIPRDVDAFDTTIYGNREDFIAKVKELCVDRDFRVRIPYADRFDRDGFLQLTFMCSMSTFFHRKRENFIGCPFRLVYKATDVREIRSFKMFHMCDHHNHSIAGGLDDSPEAK